MDEVKSLFVACVILCSGTVSAQIIHKGIFDFLFSIDDCYCKCGIPNREAKFTGGEFLRSYEFPWLASVRVRDEASVSGTLINDRYVITSATQMIGLTPYDLKVSLGQFDRCFPDVSTQNVSVDSVTIHPEFSPGNRANDLALIKLTTPVRIDRRISPICLSTPWSKYTGQVATVAGWSETPQADGTVSASCRPRKLGLPVLGEQECTATAFDPQYTSVDKGCIGIVGANGVICATDAGGPVMYRSYGGVYELIGVLSDTNDCSTLPSTSMFTLINHHLSWIRRNTRDACYCIKT